MPLSRYEIRNEYSLADPDLYGVADKDDPEALLEVVAMSGLVGVLRQLGDLAEFAAEIFHGLHEEVMATAARGHGLIVRLQQLEAEFPSIEKRLLAQMSHTDFLYSSGVDWHPNLHMNQNSITGGDLPRFIMDSYEECHGPPRLFLLDKFDVAGAGACLKRYTDPSFFKVEAACYGITKSEVQREKRTRKVKRRGQQWRNGESSEPIPSSHAKLHQLLLEEQFENGGNDPEHRVKLKKREMTKSPLDEIAGKSYMEKFLETCLSEREMSISSPCMDLTSNNTCESGLEIVEIGTVSPARESLEKERTKCSSLNIKEMLVKPSLDELNELIDEESIGVSGSNYESNSDKNLSTISKMISPEELAVYAESKSEYSLDENNSAEAASDLDNYMDAIAMMESETETSECRTSKNSHFVCRIVADSDASEGHDELQMALLDSQSVGNTIESDPANISFEESGSFLCSHTVSILAESTPLNGVAAIFSTPTSGTATAETSSDHQSISEEASGNKTQYASCNSTHVEAVEIQKYTPISEEASSIACNSDQNMSLQSADAVVSLDENSTLGLELYDKFCNSNLVHMSRDTYQRRESQSAIVSHSITISDAIPHARDHILVSAEGHPVDVMACENSEISSIALQDLPNRSDASEDNRSTGSINKVLETEPANSGSLSNMADGMMSSSLSVRSHGDKLNFNLGLQEVETSSDVVSALKNPPVSASDHLEIMKPARFAAEENHCIPSTEENSEKLPLFLQPAQSCSLVELHPSEITDAGLLPPHHLPEEAVRVDKYEHSNREISTATETEVMMTSMLSGKQSKIMSDASEESLSSGSFNEVLQTGTANDVCLPTNSVGSPGNKWTHDLGWPEIEACLDNASLQKNAPISSSRCPEITKPVDLAVEENHCIPPTRENSENPPLFLDPAQSGCPVGQHPSEIIDVDLLAQHYFPEEAAPVDGNEQSNNSNISTDTETKEMMTSMLSVDQSKIMSDASEENLSSGSFDEVLQTGPTNDGCLPNLVYGMICSPDSVGLHGDRWTHDLSWPEVEACLDVGSLLNNAPVSTCSYAEITKPADVAVEENHCIPSTEENLENLPLFLDPAQNCSPVEQNPFETIDAGLSPLHYLPDGAASANGYEVSNKGIPAAIENVEMIAYMSQVVQSETTTDFSEENCSSRTFNEVLQTGRGNDGLLPNLVDGMMGSPHSFSSPGDKRIHDLGWPAVDACLDVASLLDNASVSASCPEIVKPADLAVEEDHCIPSTEENSANLCHSSGPEQNCSLVVKNPSKASLSPLHYLPEDAASANGDEVSNRGIPTAIENAEMIASMLPADPSETMSDAYEDNHGAGSFNEVLQTVSANDGSLRDLADGIMGTICSVSSGHLCTCDSNQQEVEACLDDASPLFSSPVSTSSSPGVTKLAGSAPEGGHILSTEEHSEGLLLLEPAQSCRPLDMHTSEITDADCSPHLNLPEKAAPVCRYELGEKTLENELMAASVSSVKQSEIPDPVSGPLQTHINLLADEIHAGPTDPSCSEIYMLSMLPNASEINPEEMPPLPPLPPMQWRLGKLQHACLPKERPMMEHAHGPVKLIPAPAVDCNEEIFPLASMAEKAKGVNPLLSLSKIEDENFPNISVYSRGYMVPGTFTQPMISMEQQNALNVDRQLDNPLYSTHVTCVRSTNGLPTPEMEPNQPNTNLLEPGLTIKNLLLGPVAASVNGKEIQPEAAIIDDQLQHFPSVTVQESMKPSGQFMLVPTMIYEQKPPQGFMTPEEVTTWLSNTSNAIRASDDGNANGTLQKKIPRPRNPLIDEVVALDKSKLRKVGERVQVVEKAEERDTLLEQIRNKSVNLKPAATTRPSIQGPKTNLKVAAILEKANTIRQAMAGSDEDDSDSWSDS